MVMLTRLLSKSLAFSFPLSILILLLNLSASLASDSDSLLAGQVVRIDYDTSISKRFIYIIPYSHQENRKITGRIISWDSSLVIICIDSVNGETKEIYTTEIKNMYIRDGKKRAVFRGLTFGAYVGSITALMGLWAIAAGNRDIEEQYWGQEHKVLAISLSFSVPVVIGGVIGWLSKIDRWSKVDKENWPINLSVNMSKDDLGARLTYSF